jgi:hypothetical protein
MRLAPLPIDCDDLQRVGKDTLSHIVDGLDPIHDLAARDEVRQQFVDEGDLSRIIRDVGVVWGQFGLWDVLDEFPRDLGGEVREIFGVVVLIVVPLDCVIDDRGSSSGFKFFNFAPFHNSLIMIYLYEDQRSHLLWYGVGEYLSQR